MNRRWFVEIEGRAQGPFDQSQVQDLARLKRIQPMTRIFAEGDVRWRLMNEFNEFKTGSESSSHILTGDREWVVLKRKTLKDAENSPNKFDQVGPFSVAEIDEQLKRGEVSYNDYVWKKGFQRWAKLETLPEFNHTLQSGMPPPPEAPKSRAFVSEPKLELDEEDQDELDHFTNTNTLTLAPTQEAKAPAAPAIPEKPKQPVKLVPEKDTESEAETDAVLDDEIQLKPGIPLGRKILRFFLATAAAIVMTVTVYTFVKENYLSPEGASDPEKSEAVSEIVEVQRPTPPAAALAPPPKVATPAARADVAKVAVPKLESTEMPKVPRLEIEVIRPESQAQIVLSTNAPTNFPIEVKLTGKSGQILRYTSYSQALKIQRQNGEVPTLDLANLKLPFGTYTVQAKFDDLSKQKTFFYGVNDEKFQKQLEAQIKKVSSEQILEKKMVFYYLRDIEELTKKLESQRAKTAKNQKAWKQAYAAWRKDVQKAAAKYFAPLNSLGIREVAYPEMIAKAKELGQMLLKQGGEVNSEIIQNRYVSNSGIGPILAQIRTFKREVAALSRY